MKLKDITKKSYEKQIIQMIEKIEEADAILIGAASGMSAAAGYTHWYEGDKLFHEAFADFYKKYGFEGSFNGFYYHYRTPEERWAFIARLVHLLYESPTGETYYDLMDIIKNKNYHILTTNQDFQFTGIVPEQKISAIQGDWRYYQCSRRCHDELYDNKDMTYKMNEAITDTKIPTEMLPMCPKCGQPMEPWVRSFVFLEGKKFNEEHEKWQQFVLDNQKKKILFIELGVGRMTPMFIQEPFWNLTYNLPNAYYITINPKDALLPEELKNKGMAFHEDIAKVLADVKEAMKNKNNI